LSSLKFLAKNKTPPRRQEPRGGGKGGGKMEAVGWDGGELCLNYKINILSNSRVRNILKKLYQISNFK